MAERKAAKAKAKSVQTPTNDTIASPTVNQPATKASEPTSVTVYDVRGNPARTYSLDIHGKDFRALAESFAKKRGWTVR